MEETQGKSPFRSSYNNLPALSCIILAPALRPSTLSHLLLLLRALGEDGLDRVPNNSWALRSVDGGPDSLLPVVVGDFGGLLVVCTQSLSQCLGVVVGSLDQGFTSNVVSHGLLWWGKLLVVRSSRSWVDQTTSDTRDEERVLDLELDGMVELLRLGVQHVVELLSLGCGSGEAVEDEARQRALQLSQDKTVYHNLKRNAKNSPASALVVGLKLVLDHTDHDLIRDESTGVHDLLCLLAELCTLSDLLTEHVAGSQVADLVVELLQDLGCLCSLSGAWRADEDHADTVSAGACRRGDGRLGGALDLRDLLIELGDEAFEVGKLCSTALLLLALTHDLCAWVKFVQSSISAETSCTAIILPKDLPGLGAAGVPAVVLVAMAVSVVMLLGMEVRVRRVGRSEGRPPAPPARLDPKAAASSSHVSWLRRYDARQHLLRRRRCYQAGTGQEAAARGRSLVACRVLSTKGTPSRNGNTTSKIGAHSSGRRQGRERVRHPEAMAAAVAPEHQEQSFDDSVSYEETRLANIKANAELLVSLGLSSPASQNTPKPRPKKDRPSPHTSLSRVLRSSKQRLNVVACEDDTLFDAGQHPASIVEEIDGDAYEKQRLANIQANAFLLSELGIDSPQIQLQALIAESTSKHSPGLKRSLSSASSPRPGKRQRTDSIDATPVRRSSRPLMVRRSWSDSLSIRTRSLKQVPESQEQIQHRFETQVLAKARTKVIRPIRAKHGGQRFVFQEVPLQRAVMPRLTQKRRPDAFGTAPRSAVGDWFSSRTELVATSMHSSFSATVGGDVQRGCRSLCLTELRPDDTDAGEALVFSLARCGGESDGDQSRRGPPWQPKFRITDPNLGSAFRYSDQERCLRISIKTGKPVRVIRGYEGDGPYAPPQGYVYSGLYKVTDSWLQEDFEGHVICRIRLERCIGQPPLPTFRKDEEFLAAGLEQSLREVEDDGDSVSMSDDESQRDMFDSEDEDDVSIAEPEPTELVETIDLCSDSEACDAPRKQSGAFHGEVVDLCSDSEVEANQPRTTSPVRSSFLHRVSDSPRGRDDDDDDDAQSFITARSSRSPPRDDCCTTRETYHHRPAVASRSNSSVNSNVSVSVRSRSDTLDSSTASALSSSYPRSRHGRAAGDWWVVMDSPCPD